MEFFGFEAGRRFDRRIGRRAIAGPIDVRWVVPASGILRATREHPGRIEEVSLTGAAVTGPAKLRVEIGDTVLLRYEGGDSSVIVRRRDPTDEPDLYRYGVELLVVHPMLRTQLLAALSQPDGGDMGSANFQEPRVAGSHLEPEPPQFDALAATEPGPEPESADEPGAGAGAGVHDPPEAAVAAPMKAPRTSAADAGEVRDLVDELRRFMED
jgi:hypothetical protein